MKQLRQYEQTITPTATHRQARRAVETRTIADMGVEVRWLVHHLARILELATAARDEGLGRVWHHPDESSAKRLTRAVKVVRQAATEFHYPDIVEDCDSVLSAIEIDALPEGGEFADGALSSSEVKTLRRLLVTLLSVRPQRNLAWLAGALGLGDHDVQVFVRDPNARPISDSYRCAAEMAGFFSTALDSDDPLDQKWNACLRALDIKRADLEQALRRRIPRPAQPDVFHEIDLYELLDLTEDKALDAWAERIARTMSFRKKPGLYQAARQSVMRAKDSPIRRHIQTARGAMKEAVEIALRETIGRSQEPWMPRYNSRCQPIVPARDLERNALRKWTETQTRAAAFSPAPRVCRSPSP